MTTWDSAAHNQNATFSGGDLTVTCATGGNVWAQSSTSKAAGATVKVYWEFTVGTASIDFYGPGGGNQSYLISENIIGHDASGNSWRWGRAGALEVAGTDIAGGTAPTYTNGDTLALEWDVDGNAVRLKNLTAASAWFPHSLQIMGAINPTVTAFAMFGNVAGSGDSGTINFGGTSFTGTPEATYSAWDVAASTVIQRRTLGPRIGSRSS